MSVAHWVVFIAGLDLAWVTAWGQPPTPPHVDFGGLERLVKPITGKPLSADLTDETEPRLPDASLAGKGTAHYRAYRDGRGRVAIVSQEPGQSPAPVSIIDPPGRVWSDFDAAARTEYRITWQGDEPAQAGGDNPLRSRQGRFKADRERLGSEKVNGTDCERYRITFSVVARPDGGPDLRAVDEGCRSEDLGLLIDVKTEGPSGVGRVTVTNIHRGEPPREVFERPEGFATVEVPLILQQ